MSSIPFRNFRKKLDLELKIKCEKKLSNFEIQSIFANICHTRNIYVMFK